MKFYYDKFKELRRKNKISVTSVAKQLGVDRGTIWSWEKGRTEPTSPKIRNLASILNIPVTEISDLKAEYPLSEGNISELANSWHIFSGKKDIDQESVQKVFLSNLEELFKKFNQTSIIIKAIMSSMNFMFYVKDTKLKYITANRAFLNNTSSPLTENQILGHKDHNFFSLNETKNNEKQDTEVLLTGKPIIDSEDIIPGTRKKKWGLISKYPIFDSEGKIGGIVGTFIDITERKRNEEIREMLELSLNSVSDAYCIRELNKNSYFFVSKVIENIMGVNAKEYKKGGVDYWLKNCVHPNDRSEQSKYYRDRSWPDRREYRIIKPDGQIRLIEATCDFQHFLGKEVMCSVIRDITDKRKNEEVSELLRLNADVMESALTLSSYDKATSSHLIKYANNATERIFGYTAESFNKSGVNLWLECLHPLDKEREMNYLEKRAWPERDEYRIIKSDRSVIWIEATRRKKYFLGTEYTLTVSRDITEKKKKEDVKQLLKFSLNTASDGFIINYSNRKDVYFINRAVAELLGYPEEELYLGGTDFWLSHCVHPNDRKTEMKYIIDNSFPAKRKFRITRPNGEIRVVSVKFSTINLTDREFNIFTYKDITHE
ncbi:MAG: PAS domain-containing protein [Victivallales bacterium]|nr:PAS domain-containing protein [Victivallales bacterium]MCF7889352.1 PAS domain-containing protein [Victivallales bacterium]